MWGWSKGGGGHRRRAWVAFGDDQSNVSRMGQTDKQVHHNIAISPLPPLS